MNQEPLCNSYAISAGVLALGHHLNLSDSLLITPVNVPNNIYISSDKHTHTHIQKLHTYPLHSGFHWILLHINTSSGPCARCTWNRSYRGCWRIRENLKLSLRSKRFNENTPKTNLYRLTLPVLRPEYLRKVMTILLLTLLIASPGHQQRWHWLYIYVYKMSLPLLNNISAASYHAISMSTNYIK